MFSNTVYIHTEADYRREQLRRAYRPLVALRAVQDLTRNRTRRSGGENLV